MASSSFSSSFLMAMDDITRERSSPSSSWGLSEGAPLHSPFSSDFLAYPVLFPSSPIQPSPTMSTSAFDGQALGWRTNSDVNQVQQSTRWEQNDFFNFSLQPQPMPSMTSSSLFQSSRNIVSRNSVPTLPHELEQSTWNFSMPMDRADVSLEMTEHAPIQGFSLETAPLQSNIQSNIGFQPLPHEQEQSTWNFSGPIELPDFSLEMTEHAPIQGFSPETAPLQSNIHSNIGSQPLPQEQEQSTWNFSGPIELPDFSLEMTQYAPIQRETAPLPSNMQSSIDTQTGSGQSQSSQPSQCNGEEKKADDDQRKSYKDGYKWKKYGQKIVKRGECQRSYYGCAYPGCSTKKKVDRSLDGQITEVIYSGRSHNHPMPRRTGISSLSDQPVVTLGNEQAPEPDSFIMQEDNASASTGEDNEFDQGSSASNLEGKNDENEPGAGGLGGDDEYKETVGYGNTRSARKPKILIQITSDIDVVNDGYKWWKYGEKIVKGNPNPRSYYKCTTIGCPVRKFVERVPNKMSDVFYTYVGRHTHDVPAADAILS